MSAAAAAEGGGAVTKVHWNGVGGVGAVGIGLLLFVGGIMVGGEGEYLRVSGHSPLEPPAALLEAPAALLAARAVAAHHILSCAACRSRSI